ncbi:MAG: ABC transporter permease [Desulfitobacteriaceae bacterium]|nr:ABC transporter permease [Desulfitobacteriaceae bacterium]MDD4751803.1 ABC transporter permease [Desulfitobacteriaceae bacterium]
MLGEALIETFYMVFFSTAIAYLFGLPLGIILVITEKGHIAENLPLNKVLAVVINATRSLPFIILLVALIPFTKLLVGKFIGTTAAIVPLTIGAIPFVARMVETSLKEVEWGLIEASLSMGASPWQLIRKVLVPEALSSLVLGATITTITLIGYSAMAGFVGGGGLGDLGVRYGFYRYRPDIMLTVVVTLIVLVQLLQMMGDHIAQKLNKKN